MRSNHRHFKFPSVFVLLTVVLFLFSGCYYQFPPLDTGLSQKPAEEIANVHNTDPKNDTILRNNLFLDSDFTLTVNQKKWKLSEHGTMPALFHNETESVLVIDHSFNDLFSYGSSYYKTGKIDFKQLEDDTVVFYEFWFQRQYYILSQPPGDFEKIGQGVFCLKIPYISYGSDTGCCYVVADNNNSKIYGFYTIGLDARIGSDFDKQVTNILASINVEK